ncbi:MAG: leucine-rich repeat protein [Bacteroidota bacterium]|nr:leucine-rich repeat protein [Bacteroidota bacterium]
MLSYRLPDVCTLVAFLSLLLPGLVLAQVSEHVLSEETEFKKERGWEEYLISTTATSHRNDRIREERFRQKSKAYGLVHDRLRSETPVDGSSVVKPVVHTSLNICDRTTAVMDAILSRIPATNDCSEVTSTQLAGITGTLDLSFKGISSLKAGDFDGLISLTTLDLWFNRLSTLPNGIFDELASLTMLRLSGNDLSTFPDGIFDKLTSLTSLHLARNRLSALPAGLFDELTSLTTLDLSLNYNLSTLPVGIFDKLTLLTRLDFGYNNLSILPDGIFDSLTSLKRLLWYGNGLSMLPAGIFDGLTSLTWLDLYNNDLSALPDGIFSELTSLIVLDLSRNELSILPDGIFDGLISVTWLRLEENDLSTLPGGIFDDLTSLTVLWLEVNELSTLPAGTFDGLTSLTWLNLWSNDLSTLPDGIFDELTSLTELNLGGNDLSTLPAGIFDELTSLTSLHLGDNDLSTLPGGIFDELTSVTELSLSENDLSTLPDGIFDELTLLTGLSLCCNDLSTLPDGIFEDLAELSLRGRYSSSGLSLEANPGAPFRPVVNAGADLTVRPGSAASISGSVTGPWGSLVRWDWDQVDGPDSDTLISGALPLTGGNTARPSFTAPTAEGELYFKLVVVPGHRGYPNEFNGLAYSNPDWVTVTVSNTPTDTLETPPADDFNLVGNYPNPFNPSTTILLDLPQVAAVTVDVFNVLGRRVHREEFPAVAAGASRPLPLDVSHLSSAVYAYQVTARMGKEIHRAGGRMTLIK